MSRPDANKLIKLFYELGLFDEEDWFLLSKKEIKTMLSVAYYSGYNVGSNGKEPKRAGDIKSQYQ